MRKNNWRIEEIELAKSMLSKGKTYQEIGDTLSRTKHAVKRMMMIHGEGFQKTQRKLKIKNPCCHCGGDIPRHGKKFCSRSCSASFNNKKDLPKCLNCGAPCNSHESKHCSIKCSHELKRKERFQKIESGDISLYEKNYKLFLIEKHGEKCMECGWNKRNETSGKIPIQLDHIDGNAENNSLENLRLLCPSCHSLTPTFGILNKGQGRSWRYKK